MLYERLLRPALFCSDPERAHHMALSLLSKTPLGDWIGTDPKGSPTTVWNLTFRNPLGLAAGFDKNAMSLPAWYALGFGFVEIGTVTRHAQPGNPRPRVFRCPAARGLVNRLGFPNDGAETIARRIHLYRERHTHKDFPIGINIGKSKITPLEEAEEDYVFSFRQLYDLGDFFVVNVSSPNTPGLRDLQSPELLTPILRALRDENRARDSKPLVVKIAPDLTDLQITEIVNVVGELGLDGIVATNTTIDHSAITLKEKGGLSGKPVTARSTEVVKTVSEASAGKFPIIGVGGVFTGLDYQAKLDAGASLVEIYTSFIYRGPRVVAKILDEALAPA